MFAHRTQKHCTDAGRWRRRVKKDRKQYRGRCFNGQMRGGFDGAPFVAEPTLAEREGRNRITKLGVRSNTWGTSKRPFVEASATNLMSLCVGCENSRIRTPPWAFHNLLSQCVKVCKLRRCCNGRVQSMAKRGRLVTFWPGYYTPFDMLDQPSSARWQSPELE